MRRRRAPTQGKKGVDVTFSSLGDGRILWKNTIFRRRWYSSVAPPHLLPVASQTHRHSQQNIESWQGDHWGHGVDKSMQVRINGTKSNMLAMREGVVNGLQLRSQHGCQGNNEEGRGCQGNHGTEDIGTRTRWRALGKLGEHGSMKCKRMHKCTEGNKSETIKGRIYRAH